MICYTIILVTYSLLISFMCHNKKLSYCWETVRRESMPRLLKWTWKWQP